VINGQARGSNGLLVIRENVVSPVRFANQKYGALFSELFE
jgi:hypothetical protein